MKVIAVGFICLAVVATCSAYWNYPYPPRRYYSGPYYDGYNGYDRYDGYRPMYRPWGPPTYRPYPVGPPRYNPYYGPRPIAEKTVVAEVIPEPKVIAPIAIPVPEVQHYFV